MNVRQVVPRDAIPSVDAPEFGRDYFGDPDDRVIVVEGERENGDGSGGTTEVVRAYPVRILHYHEIVNDRLAGDPIAVTWCPLCGSAVVYHRRVAGRTLTFGVSGKLADDDLVMYDRETDSEWKQSLGEAIAGELTGERLPVRPAATTTYRRFRETYPEGGVLRRPGGASEASGRGDDPEPVDYDDAPYADYFEGDGFGLAAHRGEGEGDDGTEDREWDRDDLDPKAVVLGVEAARADGASDDGGATDGDAVGFPLPRIERAGGVARATVGDLSVAVFATPGGIHAFENPGFEFERADDGEDGTFEAGGATWDGATGESDDGRRLDRVPARRLFAFAWQDDHGADAFWSAE